MFKSLMLAAALALPLTAAATADDVAKTAPPDAPYQQVSKLVKLPDFIPGMGSLFVDPSTLPASPFVAYDRKGTLASTIYMIPLADLQARRSSTASPWERTRCPRSTCIITPAIRAWRSRTITSCCGTVTRPASS